MMITEERENVVRQLWERWDAEDRRDAVVGGLVALAGLLLSVGEPFYLVGFSLVVALAMGAAVACYRVAPGVALALVWIAGLVQLAGGVTTSAVQVAVVVVAFGTARYGSPAVLWASGLSIPAGVGIELLGRGYTSVQDLRPASIVDPGFLLVPVVLVIALAVPWAVGLLLRSQDATRRSRRGEADAVEARVQAQEIAELREQQNRLARDVHDVVGHSLTVILAQAEAAKYLPADQPERLHDTMDTIAAAARTSLHDVREVLGGGGEETRPIAAGARDTLDSLVAGVRSSGADVRLRVDGTVRPLPPEIDAVAYRTLQEMLTNALRHGDRSAPVEVEQHWDGELRLEVRNVVGAGPAGDDGRGLDGMRVRLESVGGRLDVRRRAGAGDEAATFTATAWLPVRA